MCLISSTKSSEESFHITAAAIFKLTNCLSVFDHSVGLALKGLKLNSLFFPFKLMFCNTIFHVVCNNFELPYVIWEKYCFFLTDEEGSTLFLGISLMIDFNAFIKPSEAPKRSVKIKI